MTALAQRLTSKRGAWITLALFLVIVMGAIGALRGGGPDGGMNQLSSRFESAQVNELKNHFADAGHTPALVVVSRDGDATFATADQQQLGSYAASLAAPTGRKAMGPIPSKDGKAVMIGIDVDTGSGKDSVKQQINSLRDRAHREVPAGTSVSVTGGPAFGVDIAAAFKGANFALLGVTILVVALLLLLTYRSPVLWLFPLFVVAFADQLSNVVTGALGQHFHLAYDAGVISVLVFGAGTNYALLLVSRYREQLRLEPDHRAALRQAWIATAPAILASNVTVVLSLLTLLLAAMPASRGLGIAAAVGLLIALLCVLTALPALLSLVGRRVFWPLVPRAGDEGPEQRSVFGRIAAGVTKHPVVTVMASVAILVVLALGMLGTRVGLSQLEQFSASNESATGFRTLSQHFDPGEAQPNIVMTRADRADAVVAAIKTVPGVTRVAPVGTSSDGWMQIQAIGDSEPESNRSYDTVRALRTAVHAVPGAEAKVGGANAESLDVRDASLSDLTHVAPVILGVVFLILVLLLRAVVAPLILTLINLGSALASIGMGIFVGKHLFHFPGLDVNVPLLAFLFLVALGIDYTIFLVHRAQAEARTHGTTSGMVRAVSHTGVVITSAGVVLAAVFAALGVLPLVTLGQLGLIVALGVVFDTLFVRTVLVPATFALVGDAMWWPRHLGRQT